MQELSIEIVFIARFFFKNGGGSWNESSISWTIKAAPIHLTFDYIWNKMYWRKPSQPKMDSFM